LLASALAGNAPHLNDMPHLSFDTEPMHAAAQGSLPPSSSPNLKPRFGGQPIPSGEFSLSGSAVQHVPHACADAVGVHTFNSSSHTATLIQGQPVLRNIGGRNGSGSAAQAPSNALSSKRPDVALQQTSDQNDGKSNTDVAGSDKAGHAITITGVSLSNGPSADVRLPNFSAHSSHDTLEQLHGSYSIIPNTINRPFLPVSLPALNTAAYPLQGDPRPAFSFGLHVPHAGQAPGEARDKPTANSLATSKPPSYPRPPQVHPSFSVIGTGASPSPAELPNTHSPSVSTPNRRDVAAVSHRPQSAQLQPHKQRPSFMVNGACGLQRDATDGASSPRQPLATPRTETAAAKPAESVVEHHSEENACDRPSPAKHKDATDGSLNAQARTLISRHKLLLQSSSCLLPTLMSAPASESVAARPEAASAAAQPPLANSSGGASLPWFANERLNGIVHAADGMCYIKRQSGIVVDSVKAVASPRVVRAAAAAPDKQVVHLHLPQGAHACMQEDYDDHSTANTSAACLAPNDDSGGGEINLEHVAPFEASRTHVPNHLRLLSSRRRSGVQSDDGRTHRAAADQHVHLRPASLILPAAQSLRARLERDAGKFTEHTMPLHAKGQKRSERRHQRVLLGADALRAQRLDI